MSRRAVPVLAAFLALLLVGAYFYPSLRPQRPSRSQASEPTDAPVLIMPSDPVARAEIKVTPADLSDVRRKLAQLEKQLVTSMQSSLYPPSESAPADPLAPPPTPVGAPVTPPPVVPSPIPAPDIRPAKNPVSTSKDELVPPALTPEISGPKANAPLDPIVAPPPLGAAPAPVAPPPAPKKTTAVPPPVPDVPPPPPLAPPEPPADIPAKVKAEPKPLTPVNGTKETPKFVSPFTPAAPPSAATPSAATPPAIPDMDPILVEKAAPPKAKPITSPWTFSLEIVDGKNLIVARVGKAIQFQVNCDKVEMMSPHGTIQASGHVKIASAGLDASSDRLTITLQEDSLQLEGQAHLKCRRDDQEMELRSDRFVLRLSQIQDVTQTSANRPPIIRFYRDKPE